jgi:hypothetical protein
MNRLAERPPTLILIVAYLAATAFALASAAANLRYGLTLGSSVSEQILYCAVSLASDGFKVTLPLVALRLWGGRRRLWGFAAATLWAGTVIFSTLAAIGFASGSRSEVLATRAAATDQRADLRSRIQRNEEARKRIGDARVPSVIQAEIDTLLHRPGADACPHIDGPVTKTICPKVDALKQELAVSQEAARLDAEISPWRAELVTLPVIGADTDSQSATVARVTGLEERQVRDWLAIFIAVLVEAGSALGFTLITLAKGGVKGAVKSDKTPFTTVQMDANSVIREVPVDPIARWALARLDIFANGELLAKDAHVDYVGWCSENGIVPCSLPAFGKRFTPVLIKMGGRKFKSRNGMVYAGIQLARDPARTGDSGRTSTGSFSRAQRSRSLTSIRC